jgi:plasmid maintenance system antidote protein VapI
MKLLIMNNGKVVAETNGQKAAANLLGWTEKQVSEILRTGSAIDGVTIDYAIDRERAGNAVCAYTSTTVHRYKSLAECARAYGMARKKIEKLIETGATADDGMTTFDIPLS